MLYFDNAATTLQKPEEVAQAVKESFSYIGNAGRGANEASLFTSRLIFQTRKQIAELFHMEDGEQSSAAERVVFTMNATESRSSAGMMFMPKSFLELGSASSSSRYFFSTSQLKM